MVYTVQFSAAADQDLEGLFEIICDSTVIIGAIRHQREDDYH